VVGCAAAQGESGYSFGLNAVSFLCKKVPFPFPHRSLGSLRIIKSRRVEAFHFAFDMNRLLA